MGFLEAFLESREGEVAAESSVSICPSLGLAERYWACGSMLPGFSLAHWFGTSHMGDSASQEPTQRRCSASTFALDQAGESLRNGSRAGCCVRCYTQ